MLQILTNHENDEWIQEELPRVFGLIGPAAIPALSEYLADASHNLFPRSYASEALREIAESYPESRAAIIKAITRTLERFEENDYELNAFTIDDLAEIKAIDTLPLIEKAYEAERVDEFIINLDYTLVLMGLKEPEPVGELSSSLAEVLSQFSKSLASNEDPSDFEILRDAFPDDENAPIVESLPVRASRPVREFKPIKFSRNKSKKKR